MYIYLQYMCIRCSYMFHCPTLPQTEDSTCVYAVPTCSIVLHYPRQRTVHVYTLFLHVPLSYTTPDRGQYMCIRYSYMFHCPTLPQTEDSTCVYTVPTCSIVLHYPRQRTVHVYTLFLHVPLSYTTPGRGQWSRTPVAQPPPPTSPLACPWSTTPSKRETHTHSVLSQRKQPLSSEWTQLCMFNETENKISVSHSSNIMPNDHSNPYT